VQQIHSLTTRLAYQQAVVSGGIKGLVAGSAAAFPGSYLLNKRWPYYRQLPLSLKALGVVMVVVPACVISAEHASQRFEREQWTGIGKEELDLQQQRALERWQAMSTGEKAKDWVGRHQYSFIGGAWATSMAGAFGYIMRDPHQSLSMKVRPRLRSVPSASSQCILAGRASAYVGAVHHHRRPPRGRRHDARKQSEARRIRHLPTCQHRTYAWSDPWFLRSDSARDRTIHGVI
jgi:hypothetical protein